MGSSSPISFSNIDLDLTLRDEYHIANWLKDVADSEGFFVGHLNYRFCTDAYLLEMNKQHLDHDYYTDVITFDQSRHPLVSGDVFISIDRVRDNAAGLGIDWMNELYRVMVHGLLHLIGYSDKTDEEKIIMRNKEGRALRMLH